MQATFERDSERRVLCDVAPDEVDALLAFAFERDGDVFTRSLATDSPHLDAAAQRYTEILQDMIDQKVGRRRVQWEDALTTFLSVSLQSDWALIGGTALAVRGVEVEPGDVDVVTDVEGAQALDELLVDHLIEPTRYGPGFGWFGRAFAGSRLEWLGNPRDFKGGGWSLGTVDLESVSWRGHQILVPPLDVYLRIETQRGRSDRVEAIRRAM